MNKPSFPLRMYGHKFDMKDAILDCIPPDTEVVCDLFTGSGILAHEIKRRFGCRIITNDIMRWPHLKSKVLCINNGTLLDENELRMLCEDNPAKRDDARRLIAQHYGPDNSEFIDRWSSNINKLSDPLKRDIAVFLIVVCTLNHSKYANFRYNKLKCFTGGQTFRNFDLESDVLNYARNVLPTLIINNGKTNVAYNTDSIGLLRNIEASVMVADPPYVCRAGTYESCLSFYEDLIRIVAGQASEIVNLYDSKAELQPYVNFANRTMGIVGFWDMFDFARGVPLLIVTYNTTSGIRIAEIENIARSYGRIVTTSYINRPRPTSVKGRNLKTQEAIIVCRNPDVMKGGGK